MSETVEITSVAHGGDGVGRIEGQVCFVPLALPGDTVTVEITKRTKNALWGAIQDVVEPSPCRQDPVSPNFPASGECPWAHFSYPAQGEWKQQLVADSLARIAGIDADVELREASDLRLGYRTRAEFHGDGEKLGFYARGSHEIIDIESSPLCHAHMNTALAKLRELRLKGKVTVTVNPEGEEVLVWTKYAFRRLKHAFPLASTPKEENPRSWFKFDGMPIINGTFSQSSLLLNRMLVATAHELIDKPVSVLDLYCGNGNLSAGLPERVEVVGMDHNQYATKMARRITKRDYRPGDEKKMRRLITEESWDTMLLDPPRAGAKALVGDLAQCGANAIVYVSCDPATLARDLKGLTAGGWKLARCIAVDMFPYTAHIETVCRLERR